MDKFIKDLKKKGGHILDIISLPNEKKMVYYRNPDCLVTDIKTKTF